jgi:hypothetical protein
VRELPAKQRLCEDPGDPVLQPGSGAVHAVSLEERLPRGPDVQSRSVPLKTRRRSRRRSSLRPQKPARN